MSEDTPAVAPQTAPTPAPTDPTPTQVPGPPPIQPDPTGPTVTAAEPTPEQVEEAKQFVVAAGYSYAAATQIVKDYGAAWILAYKAKSKSVAEEAAEEGFVGDLVPGRITVRVFDYDTRKPLHIMEQRDAGTEFDVYVRTR